MPVETTCHTKSVLELFEAHRAFKVFSTQVTFSVKAPTCISFEFGGAHVTLVGCIITVNLGNVGSYILRIMKFLVTLWTRKVSWLWMFPPIVSVKNTFERKFLLALITWKHFFAMNQLDMIRTRLCTFKGLFTKWAFWSFFIRTMDILNVCAEIVFYIVPFVTKLTNMFAFPMDLRFVLFIFLLSVKDNIAQGTLFWSNNFI